MSDSDWSKLTEWTKRGGTLLSVGGSVANVGQRVLGMESLVLETKSDNEGNPNLDPASSPEERLGSIQKPFDSAAGESALKLISGAIFRTKVDTTHPLLYGYSNKNLAVFRNHTTMLKPSENPYSNPMVYDPSKPLIAGYCSDENAENLKSAASTVVYRSGRGRVILLSDNPNFRGFWRGTSRVFVNGVFFGDLINQ